jgi:hypothetical protein
MHNPIRSLRSRPYNPETVTVEIEPSAEHYEKAEREFIDKYGAEFLSENALDFVHQQGETFRERFLDEYAAKINERAEEIAWDEAERSHDEDGRD